MKEKKLLTTIEEKIEAIEDIMALCEDMEGNLSCVRFELASVFYIAKLYYGEEIVVNESIMDTYTHIKESEMWDEFIFSNKDAKELLKLAEKRYEEVFFIKNNLENKILDMLQDFVNNSLGKEELENLIDKNKDFMNSLDEDKKQTLKMIVGEKDDKVVGS